VFFARASEVISERRCKPRARNRVHQILRLAVATGLAVVASQLSGPNNLLAQNAPPVITGVNPQAGPAAGGDAVKVTGDHLGLVKEVDFGATPATNLECHIDICTLITPAGSGTVDIIAKGSDGNSSATPDSRYTYLPAVTNLLTAGSFEPGNGVPDVRDTFQAFQPGQTVGPWRVSAVPGSSAAGGVEVVSGVLALSYSGKQFLKFGLLNLGNSSSPAQISQVVSLTKGHQYRLGFALAGKLGNPAVKHLSVSLGSVTRITRAFTFDTTGKTQEGQGWVQQTFTATVCAASVPVTFTQVDMGAQGPLIDEVTLTDLGLDPSQSPPTCVR
jgi:Protein of unknown function (DUF642)/IPT/TIG domain